MEKELQPFKITAQIDFNTSHHISSAAEDDAIGAVSQDGYWLWLAKEANLEVFTAHSGEKCGSWQFGAQRPLAAISAVTEVSPSLLGVAVTWGACTYSVVCLLDLSCFKVVRAVELPCRVTYMCRMTSHPVEGAFHPLLKLLSGAVALGTDEGRVLFLDLASPERSFSDENCPDQPALISLQSNGSSVKRKEMGSAPYLLALNDDHLIRDTFHYLSPQGETICKYYSRGAGVTCLEYLPHLAMLAVGYSFGGFQLWDLRHLRLLYSFSNMRDIAVVKFTFQQPENDPCHQAYLWVVHGFTKRPAEMALSRASLFCLSFARKECVPDFGCFYKDLEGCQNKLKYYLGLDPKDSVHPNNRLKLGSRLTSCVTIHRPDPSSAPSSQGEFSLCALSWQVFRSHSDTNSPHNFLAIFDLNQWYRAQMPKSFRYSSTENIPFLGIFNLGCLAPHLNHSPLLEVHVVSRSIARFSSAVPLEEHYHPSSLSFQLLCFTDKKIIKGSILGLQRQVLSELSALGSSALLDHEELHQRCQSCGLQDDVEPPSSFSKLSNKESQREQLLSLALVHGMFRFLTARMRDWANGNLAAEGCSLLFFSNWAWRRVTAIKEAIDQFCKMFGATMGCSAGDANLRRFRSYLRQLDTLASLFAMLPEAGPITDQGRAELRMKLGVTQSIAAYLRANLMLAEWGLLSSSDFPAEQLAQFYSSRRRALKDRWGPLLMADRLWGEAGRSYPPDNLESGLAVYLQLGLPLETKHCLFLYLLLDLGKEPRPSVFSGPLLQGVRTLWLLDHAHFQETAGLLNGTLPELVRSHQEAVVRALMRQDQHQLALQLCLTHHLPCTAREHVLLQLDLFLANRKITEAFYFQRNYRDMEHSINFLKHFYHTCHKMSLMELLLRLPLDEYEEKELVKFLTGPEVKSGQELLVLYFLQKSRPLEVAGLVSHLPNNDERCEVRRDLISCYLRALPQSQKNLALSLTKALRLPEKWQPRAPTQLPVRNLGLPVCSKVSLMEHILARVSQDRLKDAKWGLPDGTADPPYIGSPFKPSSKHNRTVATCFPTPLSAAKRSLGQASGALDSPIKRSRCLEEQMRSEEVLRILRTPTKATLPPPPSFTPSSILKTPSSCTSEVKRKPTEATRFKEPSTPRVRFSPDPADSEESEGNLVSSKKVQVVHPSPSEVAIPECPPAPLFIGPAPQVAEDQLSDGQDDNLSLLVEPPCSEENSPPSTPDSDFPPSPSIFILPDAEESEEPPLSEKSSAPSTPDAEFSAPETDSVTSETGTHYSKTLARPAVNLLHCLEREEPMDTGEQGIVSTTVTKTTVLSHTLVTIDTPHKHSEQEETREEVTECEEMMYEEAQSKETASTEDMEVQPTDTAVSTKPTTPPAAKPISKKFVHKSTPIPSRVQTRSHRTKPRDSEAQLPADDTKTPKDQQLPAEKEEKPVWRIPRKSHLPKPQLKEDALKPKAPPAVKKESPERDSSTKSAVKTPRATRTKRVPKGKEDKGKEMKKEEEEVEEEEDVDAITTAEVDHVSSPQVIVLDFESSSAKTKTPVSASTKSSLAEETHLVLELDTSPGRTPAAKTATSKATRGEKKRPTTPPPQSPEPRTTRGRSTSPRATRRGRLTPVKSLSEEPVRRSTRLTPRRRKNSEEAQGFQPPPGIPEEPEEEEEEPPTTRTPRMRRTRLLHSKGGNLEPVSEAAEEAEKEKEDRLAPGSDDSPSKESNLSSEADSTHSRQESFAFSFPTTPPGPHPPAGSGLGSVEKFTFSPPITRNSSPKQPRKKSTIRRKTEDQERHHTMTLRASRSGATTPLK